MLDIFEDEEYVKRTVEISLTDTSEKLLAYAYIWGNQDDPDLYGEWDFEEWKRVHLEDYVKMTQEFMEELEQLEPKTET